MWPRVDSISNEGFGVRNLETWLVLALCWSPLCLLVGRFATSYQRSAGAWFLLSLFFSPVVAFIFLSVAGVPYSAVVRLKKEERLREKHSDDIDVRQAALHETKCPRCSAIVNPFTGGGVRSSEDEPWHLFCTNCGSEIEP